jgi:lysophospholipase L1-like esterase
MDLVLCGDSLTANAGGIAETIWPLLSGVRMIGPYGTYPILNEAIGGLAWPWFTTLGSSISVREWCNKYGTPSVMSVLLGTNDLDHVAAVDLPATLATMFGHVDTFLGRWRTVGTRVFLCHLPGPCDEAAAYVAQGQVRADWESAVAQANAGFDARSETIPLPTQAGDWGVGDCYHLGAAGYARCAAAIASAVLGRTGRTSL